MISYRGQSLSLFIEYYFSRFATKAFGVFVLCITLSLFLSHFTRTCVYVYICMYVSIYLSICIFTYQCANPMGVKIRRGRGTYIKGLGNVSDVD